MVTAAQRKSARTIRELAERKERAELKPYIRKRKEIEKELQAIPPPPPPTWEKIEPVEVQYVTPEGEPIGKPRIIAQPTFAPPPVVEEPTVAPPRVAPTISVPFEPPAKLRFETEEERARYQYLLLQEQIKRQERIAMGLPTVPTAKLIKRAEITAEEMRWAEKLEKPVLSPLLRGIVIPAVKEFVTMRRVEPTPAEIAERKRILRLAKEHVKAAVVIPYLEIKKAWKYEPMPFVKKKVPLIYKPTPYTKAELEEAKKWARAAEKRMKESFIEVFLGKPPVKKFVPTEVGLVPRKEPFVEKIARAPTIITAVPAMIVGVGVGLYRAPIPTAIQLVGTGLLLKGAGKLMPKAKPLTFITKIEAKPITYAKGVRAITEVRAIAYPKARVIAIEKPFLRAPRLREYKIPIGRVEKIAVPGVKPGEVVTAARGALEVITPRGARRLIELEAVGKEWITPKGFKAREKIKVLAELPKPRKIKEIGVEVETVGKTILKIPERVLLELPARKPIVELGKPVRIIERGRPPIREVELGKEVWELKTIAKIRKPITIPRKKLPAPWTMKIKEVKKPRPITMIGRGRGYLWQKEGVRMQYLEEGVIATKKEFITVPPRIVEQRKFGFDLVEMGFKPVKKPWLKLPKMPSPKETMRKMITYPRRKTITRDIKKRIYTFEKARKSQIRMEKLESQRLKQLELQKVAQAQELITVPKPPKVKKPVEMKKVFPDLKTVLETGVKEMAMAEPRVGVGRLALALPRVKLRHRQQLRLIREGDLRMRSGVKAGTVLITEGATRLRGALAQVQVPVQVSQTEQRARTSALATFGFSIPVVSIPPIVPPVVPFAWGFGVPRGRGWGKPVSLPRGFKYVPSLTAQELKVFGKPITFGKKEYLTGLAIRPIVKGLKIPKMKFPRLF